MNEYLDNINNENMHDEGQITYANEVVSTIVSVATTEVDGISGISGSAGAMTGIIGRNKIPRGVKVEVDGDKVKVDISVTVDYGMPIQKVGRNAQENVRKSIESMTGLHVEKVDIHVIGVSFEKENKEMLQSQKIAMTLEAEEEQQSMPEEAVEVEYSEESSPDAYEEDENEVGDATDSFEQNGEPDET